MNPIYRFEFDPSPEKNAMNRAWTSREVIHMDLGKIFAIHSAEFVDRMGHGGHFVAMRIEFQLRDKPLYVEFHVFLAVGWQVVLERLQVELDKLIKAWEEYRHWELVNRGVT